jgi:hypothetical protein
METWQILSQSNQIKRLTLYFKNEFLEMLPDPISESAARTMGHFERPESCKIFRFCRDGLLQDLERWMASLNQQQSKFISKKIQTET